jgi:putative ABC transport system permease protein
VVLGAGTAPGSLLSIRTILIYSIADAQGTSRRTLDLVTGSTVSSFTLTADLRHAWRALARSPAFTIAAILTLGVGIGLNAAIFGAVHGVLLRPFELPHSERLVTLWQDMQGRGGKREDNAGWAVFTAWRARSRSFAAMAAYGGLSADLSTVEPPENVEGARVSHEFFAVLGVQPILGRGFMAQEETKGKDAVAILSHGLWERRFAADPTLVGRVIAVNGQPVTVVGILPRGFRWALKPGAEIWLPQWLAPLPPDWGSSYVGVVGRLKAGISPAAAQAELDRVAAALRADHPVELRGVGARLVPLLDAVVGPTRRPLWLLLGAAGLVLLMASLNVASLGLARATARGAELAMRLALGAGRPRLRRLFVAEGLLLGAGGGAVGLLLGHACLGVLRGLAPPQTPRLDAIRLDGTVIACTLAGSLAVGLAAGWLPAVGLLRRQPFAALRGAAGGGATRGALRSQGVLIVAEIAASVVLVGGAGILLRSLLALSRVDPGFRTENMVVGHLNVRPQHPPGRRDVADFVAQLEERLRSRPEVAAVGVISPQPLADRDEPMGFAFDDQRPTEEQGQSVSWRWVSPGYFAAFRVPLVAGRFFTPDDTEGRPQVALVNEQFVRRYVGGGSALGRRLRSQENEGPQARWRTIVGVVGDLRGRSLDAAPEPELYIPLAQQPSTRVAVVMRASHSTAAALGALQEVARGLRPGTVVSKRQTMQEVLDLGISPRRFAADLTATFAGVALLLAAVGIYGVTSLAVSQRRRELAVRQAMGAAPLGIAAVVLRWCGLLLAAGLVLGLGGWAALSRVVEGLLYDVRPLDGLSIAAAVGFLALATFAAALGPAWRASRIDAARVLTGGM